MTQDDPRSSFFLTRDAMAGWTHEVIGRGGAETPADRVGLVDVDGIATAAREPDLVGRDTCRATAGMRSAI